MRPAALRKSPSQQPDLSTWPPARGSGGAPSTGMSAPVDLQAGPAKAHATEVLRCDLHVHSRASSGPAIRALGWTSCPECYSEPEQVYDLARRRGMDLVAITDHDTIAGAMELQDRGFPGVIVGQEVTVQFPEDRCRLHVLVWGLSPELAGQIDSMRLRDDVYAFARWLREHNLPHSLAHPLYSQNGRLTRRHLERCALLFRAFELLNGAHAGGHHDALDRYVRSLTPSVMHRLVGEHGIEPLWPRIWEKVRTAGSDDHGLLNVGRTWTAIPRPPDRNAIDPREFLRAVMNGQARTGGAGGHAGLLAHQLSAVAAHYAADVLVPRARPRARYAAAALLRFAGVHIPRPSLPALAWDTIRARLRRSKGPRYGPLLAAIRESIGPVLAEFPEIARRVSRPAGTLEPALASHGEMASFSDTLYAAVHRVMASSALSAARRRDKSGMLDHLVCYLALEISQAPYLFSLFHQNKDRLFVQRLERELLAGPSRRGGSPGAPSASHAGDPAGQSRPMKVLLFTDTLADINGPSRFVQNIADQALLAGRDLRIFASTRIPHAHRANVTNFEPILAMKMPKYENLDLTLPPLLPMLRAADAIQPDVVHISTPGPVGLVGLLASRMLRCPAIGVYHTDFPAYIDRLFEDHVLTSTSRHAMRLFYSSFQAIFTRSEDYAQNLRAMGVNPGRLSRLLPGIDLHAFGPRFRDTGIWEALPGRTCHPGPASPLRVLYCGRVSVEKNLPLLARIWKLARQRLLADRLSAELIIVGDGPYRATMEQELKGQAARFLGFRHGAELSAIYASSDLFVFPSVTDTLGQVVMESQASGLPALVTDQGGPKEIVHESVTGHILRADLPGAWADAIVALCADAGRREQMGRAAAEAMDRRSISASFDHFWSVHEEVWREHLDAPPSRGPAAAVDHGSSTSTRTL